MELYDIENLLCNEAIQEICKSGSNDKAVNKWTAHYMHDLKRLGICASSCKRMIEDYSVGTIGNNMGPIEQAIWLAAWNVYEIRLTQEKEEEEEQQEVTHGP